MPFAFHAPKPLLGASINWGHPLAARLSAAWVLNEQRGRRVMDRVGGRMGAVGASVTWAGEGVAIPSGASNTPSMDIGGTKAPALNGVSFSAVAVYSHVAGNSPIYAQGSITGTRQSLHLQPCVGGSATTIRFGLYGDDQDVTCASLTTNAQRRRVTVFTFDSPTLTTTVIHDGVVLGTRTTGGSISLANNDWLIGDTFGYGGSTAGCRVHAVYLYTHRVLTVAEARALTRHPYAMWGAAWQWRAASLAPPSRLLRQNALRPRVFAPGRAR